jgi:hypothetical protein
MPVVEVDIFDLSELPVESVNYKAVKVVDALQHSLTPSRSGYSMGRGDSLLAA